MARWQATLPTALDGADNFFDMDRMPPEANVFLRPNEIEAVADYVLAHVKGKGEPNYDECIAFFGDGSRVCNIYKEAGHAAASSDQSEKAKP